MPLHNWIDDDFAAFRAGLLSITPSVPLQLNLRALMGPALGKLRRYSKSTVTLHFFTNPTYRELHVMTVGASEQTAATLARERQRRSAGIDFVPDENLPVYVRRVLDSPQSVDGLFESRDGLKDEEYQCHPSGPLLALLAELAERSPAEFKGVKPGADDFVIILPLRNARYPRLGHFVLWAPGDLLCHTIESTPDREIRSRFQTRMRQIMVRLFTNYYKMDSDTYLPSYYVPGRKEVTLLSAEIGSFHHIWDQVRISHPTTEARTSVRRKLVDTFGRIGAETVEANRGRIDHNWGSGFLAVFGEYPDDPKSSPRISLKEALTTASMLVESFSRYAGKWMKSVFMVDRFNGIADPTTPTVGIGVARAPVLFDYFGSADHRTFLAVGEHVSFVKTLASIAGTSDEFHDKPILLHQSAAQHARDILTNAEGYCLAIPGVAGRTRIFPISRENLMLQPGQSRTALAP
jgi:class 3 adenylate cyclase